MLTINDQLRQIRIEIEAESDVLGENVRELALFMKKVFAGRAGRDKMIYVHAYLKRFVASAAQLPKESQSVELCHELAAAMRALEVLEPRVGSPERRFMYYPLLPEVESVPEKPSEAVISGAIVAGYGTSMYEFHYEYPIEGKGVRKDRIIVVEPDGRRVTIFDYCREHGIVVYCNRCGKDITYEVSFDCPARAFR